MTDDHDRIYYQINQAKEAIASLNTQVALMAQSNETMAKVMTDHMDLHKENASTWKSSAITFGFAVLAMALSSGVAVVVSKLVTT